MEHKISADFGRIAHDNGIVPGAIAPKARACIIRGPGKYVIMMIGEFGIIWR
jgi:hypothetical protein